MTKPPTILNGSFVDELLHILKENPFRDPILDAVRKSTISRRGISIWVGQALLVVKEFPRFISAIHSNCPSRPAQQLLAENLWEEHGRGRPEHDHYTLLLRLAASLKAPDEVVGSVEAFPETTEYIDHCLSVTQKAGFVESMAAIGIGIEFYMPSFFGSLAAALRTNYDLSVADVEYLMVHVTEDEDHARRSIELIQLHADTEEARQKARQALKDMLAVKNRFAESLYNRCMAAG
jgi:pyrroloquinoline-quinone synthase